MADSKKTKCIKFKEYSLNIVRQPSLGDKKIKTLKFKFGALKEFKMYTFDLNNI